MKGIIKGLTVDNVQYLVDQVILINNKMESIGSIEECTIQKRMAFRINNKQGNVIREFVGSHKYIIDYVPRIQK